MRTDCHDDMTALEPYAEAWNRLAAGMPFRSWEWLSTWWRHYGPTAGTSDRKRRLQGLCVFDEAGELAGLAPCYVEESITAGRVLRLLGDGEVCSEYLGVLAAPGLEEAVASAIAEHLADRFRVERSGSERWDLIRFEAVDVQDPVLRPLLERFGRLGAGVHCRPGPGCWRRELPDAWETLVVGLSKNQRKQCRRLLRRAEKRSVVLHKVECLSELPRAFEHLVDLHQRRWQGRGRPGCFASNQFLGFHRDVTPALLRTGQLHMVWLEAEGKPLAIEYQLAGVETMYIYQAGIDPDRLFWEPGHVATAHILQRAIAQGLRWIDFLRGDEPYKRQWNAAFHGNTTVRVVAPRPGARLRHRAWLTARTAKDWARRSLQLAGMREAQPWETSLLEACHE